jgi:hypothetical protein
MNAERDLVHKGTGYGVHSMPYLSKRSTRCNQFHAKEKMVTVIGIFAGSR